MLPTTAPRPGAVLRALGEYRPARVVGTPELARRLGVEASWITERCGITERRFAGEGESLAEMSAFAGGKALAAAGVDPAEVGLLLLATCTPPSPVPAVSTITADLLGVTGAALDLNAACAGFCHALALAADTVRAGSTRHVLVIGAERFTDWVDPTDVGTAMLFADGAGAALVSGGDSNGIGPVIRGTDGSRAGLITIADRTARLQMDGRAVFRWAATAIAPVAREAIAAAGLQPADLAGVVLHQANQRIVDAVVRHLGLEESCAVSHDGAVSGNTSAATVPLGLGALLASGQVTSGAPVLLLGFGAGLSWAGQVVLAP